MSKFASMTRFENFIERFKDKSLVTLPTDAVSAFKVDQESYLVETDFLHGYPVGTYGFEFSYKREDGKFVYLIGTPTPWGNVVLKAVSPPNRNPEELISLEAYYPPIIKNMRLGSNLRPEVFLQFWFHHGSDEKSGWCYLFPQLKKGRRKHPVMGEEQVA